MTTADAKLRVTADVGDAQRKVRGLGDSVGSLNGTVKTGQERIEKLATAVTGTASVLGGMGAKAGAAAGAVSNLAMAFIAGGPLLAGMALATTGAAALASAWQEAEENAKAAAGAFDTVARSIADTSLSRIRTAQEQVNKLSQSLATFGMGGVESQLFLARGQREIVGGSIENLRDAARRARERRGQSGIALARQEMAIEQGLSNRSADALREQFEIDKRTAQVIADKLAAREKEAQLLEQQIGLLEELDKRQAGARGGRGGSGGRQGRTLEGGSSEDFALGNAMFLERMRREAAEEGRRRDAQEKAEQNRAKRLLDIERDKEKERTKILAEEIKERERLEREQVAMVQQLASEVTGFLASVSIQFFNQTLDVIEQLAAGQEVAFANIAAAFIRNIGTQIFGIGARATAEGLALAPTLLMPGGQINGPAVAAHLAIGTTLTGVGAQMAVSGAVAQGLISRNAGSAGGSGALGGGALAPRGGGGGDDGPSFSSGRGNITINFNGGTQLGDPTERAVSMAHDQRRARRNVYIPPGA